MKNELLEKKLLKAICASPKKGQVGPCLHVVDHVNLIGGQEIPEEQLEAFLVHIAACTSCAKEAMETLVRFDWLETPEGKAQMKIHLDEVKRFEEEGTTDDHI